jgi:hypothetical protein
VVDQSNPASVKGHADKCEGRPYSADYCNCEVDQGDSDEAKAQRKEHTVNCGRKPISESRPVKHGKTVASDDVDRCHVCSISDQELKNINSPGLVAVKGVENQHACPAHADCYFDPTNFWNEGEGDSHRVVARDAHTGEIIDPNAREVVRAGYEEKANETTADEQDG